MKKNTMLIGLVVLGIVIMSFFLFFDSSKQTPTKEVKEEGMVLVLAAPSVYNTYYEEHFEEIVKFQINYAKKVQDKDKIRIVVDPDTKEYYSELPSEIIIVEELYDIWTRDFSTVNPLAPVQFAYTTASMSYEESVSVQKSFDRFANKHNIAREKTDYIIDGGNIVDDYNGRVITTTRFLEDNDLTYEKGKEVLKELLNAREVAILEPDDDVLAHSDGMVSWIDENVLLVNDYLKDDPEFHSLVIEELESSFPGVKIVLVPVEFDDNGVDTTKGIGSACGIYVNLVSTYDTLYVPQFGSDLDSKAIEIIKSNTSKNVVAVDASGVCLYGGSVRCTTWQIDNKISGNLLN